MTYRPAQQLQPSYISSTDDPALSPAAEIDTGWIDMEIYDKYQFEGVTSVAGSMQLVIESSNQSGGGLPTDRSSTTPIATAFHLFNVLARQRFMRWRWQNVSGSPVAASLAIKAPIGSSDKLTVAPVGTDPTDFSQAALTVGIIKGQQPDGDYATAPAGGTAFLDQTPLAGAAVYESPWTPTAGYSVIEFYFASDQPSATDGVIVEYTDDVDAVTPVVRSTERQSLTGGEPLSFRSDPTLEGFRVRYVNGATPQTSFLAQIVLRVAGSTARRNGAGAQLTSDFLQEVRAGRVPGFKILTRAGINTQIQTVTTPESVWSSGGLYTGQPPHADAAELVNLSSSSSNDDAAGTGARTVRMTYLDDNWNEVTEEIALAGTAPVASTLLVRRCTLVQVLTAGSGGANAGVLSVVGQTSGRVYIAAPVGNNESVVCAITVPANFIATLISNPCQMARTNGQNGAARVQLRAREEGEVYRAVRDHYVSASQPFPFDAPRLVFPPKTDLVMHVEFASDNTTVVSADIGLLLERI